MAATWFTKALKKAMEADLDLTGDIRMLLLKTTATITDTERDGWEFVADAVASSREMGAAGGYARQALTGKAVAITGLESRFTSDTPVDFGAIDSSGGSPKYSILFLHTGSDATAPLIGYMTGGAAPNDFPWTPDGGDLEVVMPSDGWLKQVNVPG